MPPIIEGAMAEEIAEEIPTIDEVSITAAATNNTNGKTIIEANRIRISIVTSAVFCIFRNIDKIVNILNLADQNLNSVD